MISEVEFTASDDSELAIFVGPFATSGNYFIQFLSAKENYGIGCYGQSGGRKACTLSWTPGRKQRAKIELTKDGYRFYFDPGEGYELAADR